MTDNEQLRRAMQDAGERAFNSLSEEELAAVSARVFPEPIPGVTRTVTSTVCRAAFAAVAVARAGGLDPRAYWAFFREQTLRPIIDRGCVT